MKLFHSQSNKIIRFSAVLFTLTLFLSACNGASPESSREIAINQVQVTLSAPTPEPYVFKTSEPDTITVKGELVVLDPMSMIPAPDDAIYVVPLPTDQPISTVPQFDEGTVPQAEVDERNGEFVFINLQPGQYAVVAVTKGGAQIPVRYMDSSSFAIFTLDPSQTGTTVELGRLTLP